MDVQSIKEALEKLAKGEEKVIAQKIVDGVVGLLEAKVPNESLKNALEAEKAKAVDALAALLDKAFDKIDGKVG